MQAASVWLGPTHNPPPACMPTLRGMQVHVQVDARPYPVSVMRLASLSHRAPGPLSKRLLVPTMVRLHMLILCAPPCCSAPGLLQTGCRRQAARPQEPGGLGEWQSCNWLLMIPPSSVEPGGLGELRPLEALASAYRLEAVQVSGQQPACAGWYSHTLSTHHLTWSFSTKLLNQTTICRSGRCWRR